MPAVELKYSEWTFALVRQAGDKEMRTLASQVHSSSTGASLRGHVPTGVHPGVLVSPRAQCTAWEDQGEEGDPQLFSSRKNS